MSEESVLAVLQRLDGGMREIGQRMTELSERMARMEARLERVEARLDQVEGQIQQLRADLTEFRVVTMEKFERVEDRFNLLTDDITTAMGSAMHVRRRQEGDREDIRSLNNLLDTVILQVRRLQTNVEELQKKAS